MVSPISKQRRQFVKQSISMTTMAMVATSGLALPKIVLAHWPKDAFTAETVEDALLAILGEAEIIEDNRIQFSVGSPPSYAVNGASVPVEVNATLENIERMIILVDKNPYPLAASIDLSPEVILPYKTMIKIAEDATVMAVVRADGKLYRTQRDIRVDIGGCA